MAGTGKKGGAVAGTGRAAGAVQGQVQKKLYWQVQVVQQSIFVWDFLIQEW